MCKPCFKQAAHTHKNPFNAKVSEKASPISFPFQTGGTFTVSPKVTASYFSTSSFMWLEELIFFFFLFFFSA